VALERLTGRELDLSAWFARPCVVVMGFVDDVPIPVPLTVDGERVGGRGTVMMRWVLPLETDVERAFAPELEAARARAETEAGPPAGES
jgi:hypothetical protein